MESRPREHFHSPVNQKTTARVEGDYSCGAGLIGGDGDCDCGTRRTDRGAANHAPVYQIRFQENRRRKLRQSPVGISDDGSGILQMKVETHILKGCACARCGIDLAKPASVGNVSLARIRRGDRIGVISGLQFTPDSAYRITKPDFDSNKLCAP